MKIQSLIFAICLILAAPAWADAESDLQKGWAAYALGNYETTVYWIRKAAEQGHVEAQLHLGWHYVSGEGVPQNDKEAVKWVRKAAEQGLAEAQLVLGLAYTEGEGVPQNDKEAVKWVRKAAEQGLAEAQLVLGLAYTEGEGVPQNDKEAVKWVRKAAEQGLAEAQLVLGRFYAEGENVPKHDQKAYMWFLLAKANEGLGFLELESNIVKGEVNKLESRLSRAEIAAAQEEAAQIQAQIENRK
ncbi:MAG: tetratricopeptide repeat protein [Alphaproteobacteria bacterium]|nr:tetratricopeptide repeat protein [Alphaproteobacteria bacterium]